MFLESNTEKIVKGIFIGGAVCFFGFLLMFLSTLSTTTSIVGHYICIGILGIGMLCKLIGIIVIFKFSCDVLHKVLKALDKYNNDEE